MISFFQFFVVPFTPLRSFKQLHSSDKRWLAFVIPLLFIVGVHTAVYSTTRFGFYSSTNSFLHLFIYCLGVLFSLTLHGILLEVISSRILKHNIAIKNGLLIVLFSSLPLLICLLLSTFFKEPALLHLGSIISTIYIGIGLKVFYGVSNFKSQLTAFLVLIATTIAKLSFMGVEL